jgi:hypothetical protein
MERNVGGKFSQKLEEVIPWKLLRRNSLKQTLPFPMLAAKIYIFF